MVEIQIALAVLFLAFTGVASNAVVAMHCRRVGKPVRRSLRDPADFPLRDFNTREWLMLAGVLVISAGIGLLALLLGGN
jgi:hypothetical protein